MQKIKGSALLLLGAALVANAHAADSTLSSADGANTVRSNDEGIQEILVTAQKRKERLQDVPLSIATQDAAQLESAGIVTTGDLPKVIPGLTFTGAGAWSHPNLRGVATTITGPGSDNPVAIYVDGMYMGNQVASLFDLPDIERVDVLKGPQGTLFGRNATGGAITINTREPSHTLTGSFSAIGGYFDGSGGSHSANELGAKGYLSGPINDQLAASVAVYYNRNTGYLVNDLSHDSFGDVSSRVVRAKLLYTPTDDIQLTFIGFYSKRSDEVTQAGLPYGGLTAAAAYPGSIIPTQPWHVAFDWKPDVKAATAGGLVRADIDFAAGKLTSLTSYYNSTNRMTVDVDGAYAPDCLKLGACVAFDVSQPEYAIAQEIDFVSAPIGKFSYVVGTNLYWSNGTEPEKVNDFSHFNPLVPDLSNSGPVFAADVLTKTRAIALFSEVNYQFTDRFVAIAGARVSYEKKMGYGAYTCCDENRLPQFVDKGYTDFSPRVSLRYSTSNTSNVYFTFSEGFKSGVVPYSDFAHGAADPEKIYAYEVGFKTATHLGSLNAAAFFYDYKDLQVVSFTGISAIITNAAQARIYGLDLDGTANVTDHFTLRGAVSYLPEAKFTQYPGAIVFAPPLTPFGLSSYTRDIAGTRLFFTPKLTASVTADYEVPTSAGDFDLSVTGYHSGEFFYNTSSIPRTDAYTSVSSQLSFAPSGSRLKYAIWGRNLTNRAVVKSIIDAQTAPVVQFDAPREIGATVTYSF